MSDFALFAWRAVLCKPVEPKKESTYVAIDGKPVSLDIEYYIATNKLHKECV